MLYNNFINDKDLELDQSQTNSGSTPYDDVFRTLVVGHKGLLLKLLNGFDSSFYYNVVEESNCCTNGAAKNRKRGGRENYGWTGT